MESLDYWRLCDELSVIQAAALIVGIDPSGDEGAWCDGWDVHRQPKGFAAAKAALVHAINGRRLPATIRHSARQLGWAEMVDETFAPNEDENEGGDGGPYPTYVYKSAPDWNLTTVLVNDLRAWLASRGIKTGFFFPVAPDAPDYLDPANPRYAPKLAAAVQAWRAVTDPGGKHPKQGLLKWLREHAAEFGLTDDEGKPNEQGIEECAKVANWQPGGGAPKTPGG